MKKLFGALAAAAFVATLTPLAAPAQAQSRPPVVAQAPNQQPAKLELDLLEPRVVSAEGSGLLTVAGKLTNVSDRKISEIDARLDSGAALTGEDKFAEAMAGAEPVRKADSKFTKLPNVSVLEPGQSTPVRLEVPVHLLQFTAPGVYPVLVNFNGTPEYGDRRRIAQQSLLIPVLGVPGTPPQPPAAAPGITMLWPLVDQPRIVPTNDGRNMLANDDLTRFLAPGGRLYELLATAEPFIQAGAPLCLAIDPDLLQAVKYMTEGYRVGTTDSAVEGGGTTVAKQWLERLKGVARGRCVLGLPYADADLVALSGAGLTDLGRLAVDRSRLVADLLEVKPVNEIIWPNGGVVDERTMADLGRKTLILDQQGLQGNPPPATPVKIVAGAGSAAAGSTAMMVDPLVNAALVKGQQSPAGSLARGPLQLQDTISAIHLRAAAMGGNGGGTMVIAPPRRWKVTTGELTALLQSVQQLISSKAATGRKLDDIISTTNPPQRQAALNYPANAAAAGLTTNVTDQLRLQLNRIRDLRGSTQAAGASSPVTPATLLDPLDLGLVRASSSAWRSNDFGAEQSLGLVADQFTALVSKVEWVRPGGPYYLASSDSTLPLTIKNNLPVRIKVKVFFSVTQGLQTAPIPDPDIGPETQVTVRVAANISRSGQFSADAWMNTLNGTPLGSQAGEPNRLTLVSTAYGTITLGITITAAGALVVLVIRRIVRRIRGSRPKAGADAVGVG